VPRKTHLRTDLCIAHTDTHTHPFNGPLSGTTQVSRYQQGKPIWILPKQETVSGSGVSWAICKSAPRSRQIAMPAPHHSVFYRPDGLPATQPTASKHWRQDLCVAQCWVISSWLTLLTPVVLMLIYQSVSLVALLIMCTVWLRVVGAVASSSAVDGEIVTEQIVLKMRLNQVTLQISASGITALCTPHVGSGAL